jgi:hypothetical protein
MSRYYFHIRKGDLLEDDPQGTEVAQPEFLEEEAVEAARDLLAEGDLQGLDRREWVYEVADERGETVLVLPFKDAVEPDLPSDLTEPEEGEGHPVPRSS